MPDWSPAIAAVVPKDFDRAVAKHPVVVVHFWASWDAYDRQMDTWLRSLRPQFEPRVTLLSFDTGPEEAWGVCRRLGLSNLPALVCFVGGQHHDTRIGLGSRAEVEERLRAWASEGAVLYNDAVSR